MGMFMAVLQLPLYRGMVQAMAAGIAVTHSVGQLATPGVTKSLCQCLANHCTRGVFNKRKRSEGRKQNKVYHSWGSTIPAA